jgi:hypothetical protein
MLTRIIQDGEKPPPAGPSGDGCLQQDPGIRSQVHQFVAYASSLEPLPDDGYPRIPEGPGASAPL